MACGGKKSGSSKKGKGGKKRLKDYGQRRNIKISLVEIS